MAHCMQNPSSPTQSNLSGSERRKIYLSQQQKQQIIQSGYKANSINAQNPQQLDHLSSFQQTHDEKSSVHGQVLDPINSLVNGWPDFNMIGSTSFDANNSVNETSLKEINKRKCESSSETKVETSNAIKRVKEDNKITNEEKNKSTKEERLSKGKNKKEFSSENSKGNAKVSESSSVTPKLDYIHVRARRGQATDSHSLAERVRRERISERMRHLQELVPGCNKVTGKAGMLDEIINYVQSLQRQVEFLSMKLAAVNPVEEIDIEDLLNRQMNQTNGQLDPTFHQFNPLQQIASCYGLGLEMAMEQPNGLNPVFNGSMPDQLGEPYINVNGSSNWDVGSQNLYGLDPNQARSLNFHFQ